MIYRWSYYLTHPMVAAKEFFLEVKFFTQRGWRGYSDRDARNIDHYLLSWLPEAIDDLAVSVHGYPPDLKTIAAWRRTLYQMSDGFRLARVAMCDLGGAWPNEANKSYNRSMRLFVKYFFNLWD